MGERTEPVTVYVNGVPFNAIGEVVFDEIPEPDNQIPSLLTGEITISGTIAPRRFRMSRKRFIKLTMARGYSRNFAVWLADMVRMWRVSYFVGYFCCFYD